MLLLVGLGNPGPDYEATRHNAGFMAVDRICHRHNFSSYRQKFMAAWAEGTIGGVKVLALKPLTYMNRSGQSVREAAAFYKIPVSNIIVCHDELDLPLGRIRVKTGGGNGGHNGLRSIDASLDQNYVRVRIGIGHPGDKALVSSYVLHPFSKAEAQTMDVVCDEIARSFPYLVQGEADQFMNYVALGLGATSKQ